MIITCLEKGYVKLIECMGNDLTAPAAARVCTNKEPKDDFNLIRRLMQDGHTSPFEFSELHFEIYAPKFVVCQMFRQRTANMQEQSGRYSDMSESEFYTDFNDNLEFKQDFKMLNNMELALYTEYDSVPNEHKSRVYSMNKYTHIRIKIDLNNWFKFLKTRLASDAQHETRVYAAAIAKIIKHHFPATYKAFEDYILNAVTFSKPEIDKLKQIIAGSSYLRFDSKSEQTKFENKLQILGL